MTCRGESTVKPKIIIDTNKARNDKGFDQLLGNRAEIEKFVEKCDIILPSMVIDEIIHQKKKYFEISKQSLTSGQLYKKLPPVTRAQIDTHLQFDERALRSDQSIPYTVIDITDKQAAFDEIQKLAVNYEAPFEVYSVELGKNKADNTDKGFKDAYIALTISQYINSLADGEKVFVLVRDRRFEEYLDKNDRIICVSDFDGFNARYIVPEVRSATVQGTARITSEPQDRQVIKGLLTGFRNTANFTSTHSLVGKLSAAATANKLTADDYLDILTSTAQNNQINWLLGDDDVREFILPIFKRYGERLNAEQYNTIAHRLGIESLRATLLTPDIDFDEMEAAADVWVELQSDIERGH
jgi:hypothetical protein